jgi:signal transduction histidine kinase
MKKFSLSGLLFFIITVKIFAQTGQAFNINQLPKEDTLLSGWKFQAGDNQQWASIGFDDSKWQHIDPGKDIEDFSKLTRGGIGWIRLHVKVDSTFANQQFMAWVSQYTASEIYLNGKLILKYGTVSRDPSKVIAYLPSREPFYIKLIPGKDNLLAVRLAYQSDLPYLSISYTPLPAFGISINNYQQAVSNYRDYIHSLTLYIIFYTLSGGMLLIICIIHLVYFLIDRSQKVNLYYCLLNLLLCINPLPNEIWGVQRFGNVSSQMWLTVIQGFVFIPGMLFLLMTIYTLFNYPNRRVFNILVLIGIVSAACIYFMGTPGFVISIVGFPIICFFEEVYVCIWAIKRQKKDAAIILTGLILFIVFTVLGSGIDQSKISAQISFEISLLSFPIGMTFYLGVQSSLTNKKLRSMLVEVQTLSAQNIAQEIEKQQLLASQNETLERQVTERTAELNQSLTELKSTQTHLIQSEKMASLGELTAGIAHEIQNPLNFVNNFSEVNKDLLAELKEAIDKGDADEAKTIANDVIDNEEKINHHGKRADGIVKSMLQHSKASNGIKEPINLNALANEYMRLSYQGLRAKNELFNADLVTNFDSALPQLNMVSQDAGKILLNLFNNAFYAVNQKQKLRSADYKPLVSVTTSAESGQVIIKVKDNGIGIPDAIKAKIMQPFFTTKPTGEGTGLGLSLTYDMVVKGHGGSIQVESKEDEGSEFIITLPYV